MPQSQRHFDAYLDSVQTNVLKSMVRIWGGRSQMRRDECIATIRRGLSDLTRIQAVLEALTPYERTALALVKQMGGAIETGSLAVALRASGVPLPTTRNQYSQDAVTLVQPLIQRGLLLTGSGGNLSTLWHSYGGSQVFSDERLLAHIGPVECVPFAVTPVSPPALSTYRRPPAVILDIVGILQAVDTLGGLQLTKAGMVRVSDMRKLARAMGWNESQTDVDGLSFPGPALAWISALQQTGLLSVQNDALALSTPIEQFARRSYSEQIATLLHGFAAARAWSESQAPTWYDREDYRVWGRQALLLALAALPTTPAGSFFAVDELDRALFDRIGEHFSLSYLPQKPYFFNKTPDEVRRDEASWREKLRDGWLARERTWLGSALASWLYALGVVELGIEDGVPVSLRLTDVGRLVLHPAQSQVADAPLAAQSAWLVQPNFDVLVYLEHITPGQLAFLERHADRVQADRHTAQYRLTRESVYRGLESGTSPDELLSGLQSGAGVPLPQNVIVEMRGWAELREQIQLRRRGRLLEYPDEHARQVALASGLPGRPVGDRFVLLDGSAPPRIEIETRVDYAGPLPSCLSITEDGEVSVTEQARDLLLHSQIDRWAERITDRTWRLTAASVAAPVKAGVPVSVLFKLLQERLTHPMSPLLGVALRAWAGKAPSVELALVTVLRCRQPAVFDVIARSEKLRPYIRGTLAPDLLLVDKRSVKMVQAQLAWAGIAVADELEEQ